MVTKQDVFASYKESQNCTETTATSESADFKQCYGSFDEVNGIMTSKLYKSGRKSTTFMTEEPKMVASMMPEDAHLMQYGE